MKEWLKQENRWVAIVALLAGILIIASIKVENRQIQWANWTGFGQDEEITVTDKFADPKCEGTDPKCQTQERTRVRKVVSGKTFWDVLSLLGVPFALAILGFWLQQVQQKQADEAAKEEVIQAYFDRLSELLIDKYIVAIAIKNQKSNSDSSADKITKEQEDLLTAGRDVIRARTLSILRRMVGDGARKGSVIRFLIETEVISNLQIDFSGADLSGAHLSGAHLQGINLSGANLNNSDLRNSELFGAYLANADISNANLSNANLFGVKLLGANLRYTNLGNAQLINSDLSNADLHGTNFNNAVLFDANLESARNLTEEQLNQVKLCRTRLPQDIKLDPCRNCDEQFTPLPPHFFA